MSEGNVPVEDWMSQQSVDCIHACLACCNKERARRRCGRAVLFKQMALEKLEQRYKKHEGSLLPEEREAVQQVIERFRNGAYTRIDFKQRVGTFYSPVSFLFTTLLYTSQLCFPSTQNLLRRCIQLCNKDQRTYLNVCFAVLMCWVTSFGVGLVVMDIFVMFFWYPLVLLFDLFLFLCSILLCYGFYMLHKRGVFVYSFKVNLVVAQASATRQRGDSTHITTLTQQDLAADIAITHAPLRRILCAQPLAKIFKDMDMDSYTFGTLEGRQVAQEDIRTYENLTLQQMAVQEEVNRI